MSIKLTGQLQFHGVATDNAEAIVTVDCDDIGAAVDHPAKLDMFLDILRVRLIGAISRDTVMLAAGLPPA